MFKPNLRRLPFQLRGLQSKRTKIEQPNSMPLVRQIEILLFDSYEDTTLTTTQLMSIIVVCVMYLRSRALPDYLQKKLVGAVDFAETVLSQAGILNPRTLERWDLDLAVRNPRQEGSEAPDIAKLVEGMDIPDDISEMDDPTFG